MEILDGLLHNRSDIPILPPDNFVMSGPAIDPPEEPHENPYLDDIDGLVLAIEYRDLSGAISSRIITCKSINPNPPGFLRAHCHLRGAFRTFRVDRIWSITELGSGEIVDKRGVLEFLAPYIDFAVAQNKATAQRHFQRRVGPGIKVLVFLAASDGHIHPLERRVIIGYARSESHRLFPDQDFDHDATLRWINHLKPTRMEARSAMLKTMQDLEHIEEFAAAMISVVYADGHLDKAEQNAARAIIEAARNERRV